LEKNRDSLALDENGRFAGKSQRAIERKDLICGIIGLYKGWET
jgi:hypothetical protein